MRVALVAAVVFCSAVLVSAQTKETRAGISNFSRVDATVACGGAVETAALASLKQDGFKSVINLRMANEAGANVPEQSAEAQKLGMKYFHLPLSGANPDTKIVDQFLATIADKSNQPVFIHCASANRVGAVWLVKRVLQDNYTIEKATAEAKAIGLSNAALEKFALDYIAAHPRP